MQYFYPERVEQLEASALKKIKKCSEFLTPFNLKYFDRANL